MEPFASLIRRVRLGSTVDRHGARPSRPDPRVAELCRALRRLDGEILAIRQSDHRFARAHHLRAAVTAYGRALDEACRVAGVPDSGHDGDLRRFFAEIELRSRGWDW